MSGPTLGSAPATLHPVRPGVWAWVQPDGSWWLNNAGAVVGDAGVLVVDTCATAMRTERFLQSVTEVAGGRPIRIAVNTHQHGDHTYGNSLLPENTVLIGQRHMREGLRVDPIIDGCPPFWDPVPDWGEVTRRVPEVTVDSSMTVHVGDHEVQLLHPGWPAHTTGDLVAWLPGQKILFAGDLVFAGLTPLVFMGSVPGAEAALDWLSALEPEVLVPGHGPVLEGDAILDVLDQHRRYYQFVAEVAAGGLGRGDSPLDVAKSVDLGEFAQWADSERIVLNIHRVYADARSEDLDPTAAFTDATSWLGRNMHTFV